MSDWDPAADLSNLDNPHAQLERAIWRNGAGEHNDQLGDVMSMTGLLLIAEYETPEGNAGIRMIVRGPGGRLIPHWRAKGLLQALGEFIDDEVTSAQTETLYSDDDEDDE